MKTMTVGKLKKLLAKCDDYALITAKVLGDFSVEHTGWVWAEASKTITGKRGIEIVVDNHVDDI